MERFKICIGLFLFLIFLGCNNSVNSKIIRNDLLKNIEEFIAYSEKSISNFKTNETDTNIYWVEFFEKNNKKALVIMQQPYYESEINDGFIRVGENLVFFNYSNKDFVDTSKLNRTPPSDTPDENSKESGLGFSAPNWAYYIKDNSLEKFDLGE